MYQLHFYIKNVKISPLFYKRRPMRIPAAEKAVFYKNICFQIEI